MAGPWCEDRDQKGLRERTRCHVVSPDLSGTSPPEQHQPTNRREPGETPGRQPGATSREKEQPRRSQLPSNCFSIRELTSKFSPLHTLLIMVFTPRTCHLVSVYILNVVLALVFPWLWTLPSLVSSSAVNLNLNY